VPGEQPNRDQWRRYWDKASVSYDRQMGFYDRVLFGDNRPWACAQATGHTLEVAVGTGRNLPFYPAAVELTGIDFSPAMLGIAQARAGQLRRAVDLQEADAQALPFPAASFDTVVCTFALCAIPGERRAVAEMSRVLRRGGLLLLADHIAAAAWPVRGLQRVLELATVPLQGEHMLRRPLRLVQAEGLQIERRERFKAGMVERLAARKPNPRIAAPTRFVCLPLAIFGPVTVWAAGYQGCWSGIACHRLPRRGHELRPAAARHLPRHCER
jgi:ubiquinone/menaquinone biosynthesis C-methylase UbiE